MDKLVRAYRRYNSLYFDNALPHDIELVWERMPNLMGYQQGDKIAVSKQLRSTFTLWRLTLLHEMVHLYLPFRCQHGKRFQNEMRRLANAGAFDGLW